MHIHRPIIAVEVIAPHAIKQLLARKHLLWMLNEKMEQIEFLRC